nr:2,3-cyclic 3-phosphodiesterase [Candidatus Cloacimonadota bacterium]
MRLFIALEPPQSLYDELCRALSFFQSLKHKGINWVRPENLHLTVNFIGEVAEHRVGELSRVIAQQVARYAPPVLKAEGIELFPYVSPRLVWLKLSGDSRDLMVLNRQLLSSLRELKIEADPKKLKLHVTLCRLKEAQSPDFERAVLSYEVPSEPQIWDTLSLYRSVLSPQGPRYDIIEQYNLNKRRNNAG